MNFCPSCGQELNATAVFCPNCGNKVSNSKATSINAPTKNEDQTTEQTASTIQTAEAKDTFNATIHTAKETIKKNTYVQYLKTKMIHPSESTTLDQKNGWINLAVLTILTALSIYALIRSTFNVAIQEMGYEFVYSYEAEYIREAISEIGRLVLPRLFISSALIYFAFIAAAFAAYKLTHARKQMTFQEAFSDLSGMLTPNIFLLAAAILLSLFNIQALTTLASILIGLSFLAYNSSFNHFINKHIKNAAIDKVYIALIANVLLLITLAIVTYLQIGPLLRLLDEISYWYY